MAQQQDPIPLPPPPSACNVDVFLLGVWRRTYYALARKHAEELRANRRAKGIRSSVLSAAREYCDILDRINNAGSC
ncbi:hypothetical protein [Lewinella sp. JB7]|uniref:hypothetical protein n=1 Tax=Lewinella sp. JB7 TaxID=2962887 RepID=UPI0020C9ACD9|nr:hypothetical protein [Lewinella sp. JB7]MCP9237182.1 hypothetical protein [Lewinella sp. JB7]